MNGRTASSNPDGSGGQPKPAHPENIAHRLRNPLHTILGYVGLLKAKASGDSLAQLDIVLASARDLLASIDALPEHIKSQPFQPPQAPAQPAAAAPLAVDLAAARLPHTDIEMLRTLLQLGRLLEIERWADGLAARLPQHADLARHIQALARSANLPMLQQLLKQCADRAEG